MAKLWTEHEKETRFLTFDICDLELRATDLSLLCDTTSHDDQNFRQVILKSIKE